ncbi:MAG: ABC transporter ATP-binding protein [bacterium]
MEVIRLDKVTKLYRKSHLGKVTETVGVEGLDLTISKGEVFGLLGLNGSGKTTTIKLMLGLLYPTKGHVKIMDKDMPDKETLKHIGYLPEAAYLNKYLTARETLEFFASISDIDKHKRMDIIASILEQVGMKNFANKRLAEFSKGMLQRISIAQSLLHNPEILVFDEPITGLDPLALKEIRQLILYLKSQRKTVFFSSHNISEVERVCDRIGIVVSGKLVSVTPQNEWINKEGRLEEIFVSTVKDSSNVGALTFIK